MPEWLTAIMVGALISTVLATLGWLIVNKLNGIDAKQVELGKKLDRYEERQAKVEKDCITWEQFEHEFEKQVKPLKDITMKNEKAIVRLQTACEQRHKE